MQMYPAYKLHDVLELPAISFFSLLNEGYRLHHTRLIELAHISDVPHMDKQARTEFYKNLEYASTHPSDILKPDSAGSSPEEIKKALQV